jgi:nicotinate phosphoribosyltransferase
VRLDSGDLLTLSKEVRKRLDEAGLTETKIVASGDLDEAPITALVAAAAPIHIFGVGTALATSQDASALSSAYKLVEYDRQPRMKLSHDKLSYPGQKQVFRSMENETYIQDTLGLADEAPVGEPLLACVMLDGKRLAPSPHVNEIRRRAGKTLPRLPAEIRSLETAAHYPVRLSARLTALLKTLQSNREDAVMIKPNKG